MRAASYEAALKLVVSYPEFPSNLGSRVSAVERTRGRDIRKSIEEPIFWESSNASKPSPSLP